MNSIKWTRSQRNTNSSKQKNESTTTILNAALTPPPTTSSSSSSTSSTPTLTALGTATATAVATTTNTGAAVTFPSNIFHPRPHQHHPQLQQHLLQQQIRIQLLLQQQQQPDPDNSVRFSVALTIPEIILAIAVFLDRSTLAQCAVVCKDWYTIFQPLLFRIVKTVDFDQPNFVPSFLDYTRFATSIEWFQESIASSGSGASAASAVPKKQAWHRLFKKSSSSSNSTGSIPLRNATDPHCKPFDQLKLVFDQPDGTPALESLSVRIHSLDPNIVLDLRAPTVTNLQIGTRGYPAPARKPKVFMENILRSFPNLVHLTLEGLFTLCSQAAEANALVGGVGVVSGNSCGNESSSSSSTASQPQAQGILTFPVQQQAPATPFQPPPQQALLAAAAHTTTIGGMTISGPFPVTPQVDNLPPTPTFASVSPLTTDNHKGKSTLTDTTATSSYTSSSSAKAQTSSIESLSLRLVDISQEGLLALARQMPRLQSLLIEEFLVPDMMIKIYRWTWSLEFIHSLRDLIPNLTSLRMAFPFDSIKEDTIIEILKSFPLLTTVGFRNSFFGTRALEVMQEHCKFVECLDVSFGNSRGFKGALLQFLQTWPHLREFEADGFVFSLDKPIDDDVPRTPWACKGLEKLVCGFSGTESMIFQHLSQFPLLSSLTISYPSMNITPIETTLAWMAKSTRLEYFWFPQTRHVPVERGSIMWILEHWPELKTLHIAGGLVSQKETVKQWCREAGRPHLVVEFDRV
ncbi:MAG: hypothetical protein J3R72DRAFT_464449 [Linnemannia gamsii]|nr:MAG: hypothetical protein J3R72DRAFT_464449 [Linnemannia gamsii]